MIVIAVANQKGGVGKTTTSICLAQELKRRGRRVLFVDTDSQCNSTAFYEAETEGKGTVIDILCGDISAKECIQKTEKGDIIPSETDLADAENMVKVDERRFTHLKRAFKALKDEYEFVIIDTPPSIGVALKNVLAVADYIIIPVEESGWALTGLMDFAGAIELARENNEKLRCLGILTVKAKDRTKKAARMAELSDTIAEKLDSKRFKTRIRESVACAEALTEFYVPLYEYAPKSTTNQDYEAFTDEVLQEIGEK